MYIALLAYRFSNTIKFLNIAKHIDMRFYYKFQTVVNMNDCTYLLVC